MLTDELPKVDLWLCNPPYTRHHDISKSLKDTYQDKISEVTSISRISSLFVYFFLRFLQLRDMWSYASFICPRSLVDSRRSSSIKSLLKKLKLLEQIDIFEDQNVFEGVDTGSGIFFLSKDKDGFLLQSCDLTDEGIIETHSGEFFLREINIDDSWSNLLIRQASIPENGIPLGDLFEIKRGIATGANNFFVLSEEEAEELQLPDKVLKPVLAKTRYCQKIKFTQEEWERLRKEGKEVYLMDLSEDEDIRSSLVRKYLEEGRKKGIHKRSLVQTRSKWFKMEKRKIPTFFFTYLARRNTRFILNKSDAVALNVFLCLGPKIALDEKTKKKIWKYLNSEDVEKQIKFIGRNYGGDTIKVEPRELDKLKIPKKLLSTKVQTALEQSKPTTSNEG